MDGLYHLRIEPQDGGRSVNAGVMVLRDGQILGGDAFFYYVGTYAGSGVDWQGNFIIKQHTRSGDIPPAFGALETVVELAGTQGGSALEATADVRQADATTRFRVKLQRIADT